MKEWIYSILIVVVIIFTMLALVIDSDNQLEPFETLNFMGKVFRIWCYVLLCSIGIIVLAGFVVGVHYLICN